MVRDALMNGTEVPGGYVSTPNNVPVISIGIDHICAVDYPQNHVSPTDDELARIFGTAIAAYRKIPKAVSFVETIEIRHYQPSRDSKLSLNFKVVFRVNGVGSLEAFGGDEIAIRIDDLEEKIIGAVKKVLCSERERLHGGILALDLALGC